MLGLTDSTTRVITVVGGITDDQLNAARRLDTGAARRVARGDPPTAWPNSASHGAARNRPR